jgi:hypothetical protein
MGGNLVLLSRGPEVEVGLPVSDVKWWEGLLEDLKPWSPNQVCTSRRLWVRMYGVPLHAWGEKTFKNIVSRCGEFLNLDAETANRSRFDVAKVQFETSLSGFIDFVIKLKVQGALYKVRVVEESEGPTEMEESCMEDQLGWSVAASSCNSGDGGAARAVLEGLGDQDVASIASEGSQQEVRQSTLGIGTLVNNPGTKKGVTVECVSNPSTSLKVMETYDNFVPDKVGVLRGQTLMDREN